MNAEAEPSADRKLQDQPESIVLQWWREAIADKKALTGPRAELKRARSLEEVVFTPLFHEVRRRLSRTRWRSIERLALVAGVLARVKEHDPSASFARQMAASEPGAGTRPKVPPSRFRRLLRTGDEPEELERLLEQVRRIIGLLEGRVNVQNLARSLYFWGSGTRKRWALDYYEHVDEHALAKGK